MSIKIHSPEDFNKMRIAGKLAAEILDYITDFIEIGKTTDQLNSLFHHKIVGSKAIPAPLNYKGFPKSICTSINEVVCHGIPTDKRLLKEGDIVNRDLFSHDGILLIAKGMPLNASLISKLTMIESRTHKVLNIFIKEVEPQE
jgi:methionine aminopeptidase